MNSVKLHQHYSTSNLLYQVGSMALQRPIYFTCDQIIYEVSMKDRPNIVVT